MLIFRGIKTFWATKNAIDVAMVEHAPYGVIELIASELTIGLDAPRIYISTNVLQQLLRLSDNPNNASMFLFNHLYLAKYLPVSRVMEVEVRSAFHCLGSDDKTGLMVGAPYGLECSPSPFQRYGNPLLILPVTLSFFII